MDPQIHVYANVPWVDLISHAPIVPLMSIVLGAAIVLVVAFSLLGFAFVNAVRGGGSTQKVRRAEAEEAKVFDDLKRGFRRMHERIDSLETLFVGRSQAELYDREC